MMTSLLVNTRAAPGEFDALTSLREGEPYFALIGRDKLAPGLIEQWVKLRRQAILAKQDAGAISDEDADLELRKCTEAEQKAWSMRRYREGYKQAAVAERREQSYTGHELSEEQKLADQIMSARIAAANALSNAASLMFVLQQLDTSTIDLGEINYVEHLRDQITPPRPGALTGQVDQGIDASRS
jgi:hypothetical protein